MPRIGVCLTNFTGKRYERKQNPVIREHKLPLEMNIEWVWAQRKPPILRRLHIGMVVLPRKALQRHKTISERFINWVRESHKIFRKLPSGIIAQPIKVMQ